MTITEPKFEGKNSFEVIEWQTWTFTVILGSTVWRWNRFDTQGTLTFLQTESKTEISDFVIFNLVAN